MPVHVPVEVAISALRAPKLRKHVEHVEVMGLHRGHEEAIRLVEIDSSRIDAVALQRVAEDRGVGLVRRGDQDEQGGYTMSPGRVAEIA